MIPKWTELEVLQWFAKNRNFSVAGVSEKFPITTLLKQIFLRNNFGFSKNYLNSNRSKYHFRYYTSFKIEILLYIV